MTPDVAVVISLNRFLAPVDDTVTWYLVVMYRGNGGIRRAQKAIQGDNCRLLRLCDFVTLIVQ